MPTSVIGIHLNLLPIRRDPAIVADPTPEERRYLDELAHLARARRPATSGSRAPGRRPWPSASPIRRPGSPPGSSRSSAPGRTAAATSSPCSAEDQLLANIALYWFTGAIGSSFWPYYARLHGPWPIPDGATRRRARRATAEFPREILRPPRSLAARTFTDIRRWSVMAKGGHFAAMEQPEALADEIRAFFRPLRG